MSLCYKALRIAGAIGIPPSVEAEITAISPTDRVPQATPSFFCRLVEDVVYWKVSRFSGCT